MPQLQEPHDLQRLNVIVRGRSSDRDRLADALSPVGSLDHAGNAILRIAELKRLAGALSEDREWADAFAKMVDYGRSKGWGVGADGLKAHCDWADTE